jgi:hypothetical protein
MYWYLAKYLGLGAIGLIIGWTINGWRFEARIATLEASYAKEVGRVLTEARNREKSLLEASERYRKDRDAKVKNLNSKLQSVNAELQQRKKRDSRESTDTAACSGATGAELSREDAEFLARLATEADSVAENLNYCIRQYNSIRKQ